MKYLVLLLLADYIMDAGAKVSRAHKDGQLGIAIVYALLIIAAFIAFYWVARL